MVANGYGLGGPYLVISRLPIEHSQVERLWDITVLRNADDAQRDDAPRREVGGIAYESDNADHQGAASYAARAGRAPGPSTTLRRR